jgi:hypothetical protein
MKILLILSSFVFLSASTKSCKDRKEQDLPPGCYKGKLEIKELCMNYTISIQSKNFDSSMVVTKWTDENTGKVYKNVFGLASRCTFPDSLKAGDEFYFTIDSTTVQNCMVCMAYYPTPPKKLSIKVLNAPCANP